MTDDLTLSLSGLSTLMLTSSQEIFTISISTLMYAHLLEAEATLILRLCFSAFRVVVYRNLTNPSSLIEIMHSI